MVTDIRQSAGFILPIFSQTDNLLALMLEYALTLPNAAALVSKVILGQIPPSSDFTACFRKAFIYGNRAFHEVRFFLLLLLKIYSCICLFPIVCVVSL